MSTDTVEKTAETLTATEGISLSERAAAELNEVIQAQAAENVVLRVWISAAGCSGLQYGMRLEEGGPEEDDLLFVQDGVRVVVDKDSYAYMPGATIEYIDNELESGFRVNNPAATQTCGCGSSFKTASSGGCGSGGCGSGGCGSR